MSPVPPSDRPRWLPAAVAGAVLVGGAVAVAVAAGTLAGGGGALGGGAPAAEGNRFGGPFDVRPDGPAAIAKADPSLTAEERELLDRIADRPVATWVTGPTRLAADRVAEAVDGAARRDAVATIVAYNIPGRDCGSHSASEERLDAADYRAWVDAVVAGLGEHRAIVVLEPDALAQLDCLDGTARSQRLALLRYAVEGISGQGSWVYIDIGHSAWLPAAEAARRLASAGVEDATGFSLNVSNYRATDDQLRYGEQVSDELGGDVHFVVDTSRNGLPSDSGEWCNPDDRGLGTPPTVDTGHPLADAFLWIKQPGHSDGECNGGPPAGVWWPEYALMLARNAR